MNRNRMNHALLTAAILSLSSPLLAGFASLEQYLAAVGRLSGAGGAEFYTTIWATNLTSAPVSFTFEFLKAGQANTSPASFADTLAPGETKVYENVVQSKLGLSGVLGGARVTSTGEVLVAERIYNQAPGADLGDTEGLFFAGVPKSFSIALGQSASIQGINQGGSEDFRYNFALLETGGGSPTVNVQLFDGSGTMLGQKAYAMQPYEQLQPNVKDLFPGVATTNGRITATVTGGTGSLIIAGAQLANTSQDSSGFEMSFRDQLLGGGGGTAGVTSLNGLTGALTIAHGANTTVNVNGSTITIDAVSGSGTGLTAVAHDNSLAGSGTVSIPLGIANGQVVRSVNGLRDAVTLAAGSNVTITPSGQTLTIAANGGGGGDLTLPFAGSTSTNSSAFSVTNGGAGNSVGVEGAGGFRGVYGQGGNTGVYGEGANSGVVGTATASGSSGVVGFGGIAGIGVLGLGPTGVWGEGDGTNDTGVYGTGGDSGYGVHGTGGTGVFGEGPTGISGTATSSGGTGVVGTGGGSGFGIHGVGGTGVFGEGPTGVSGSATTSSGSGVVGTGGSSSFGVHGKGGTGVFGEGPTGVSGSATASNGNGVVGSGGSTGYGVYGVGGTGVHGTGTTYGVFSEGNYGGTGAKFFVEPHPADPTKEIRYVCLEGRESGTYFRGTGHIVDGFATIEVPEDFRIVTSEKGLTVVAMPVGEPAVLTCMKKGLDRIVVRGSADVEFDYVVNGVRKAFENHAPIAENVDFIPRSDGDRRWRFLPPESVRRLRANGTLNEDGSINVDTAHRLGWDRQESWKRAGEAKKENE